MKVWGKSIAIAAAALLTMGAVSPATAAGGCAAVGQGASPGDVSCTYTALGRGGALAATLNRWEVSVVRDGGKVVLANQDSGSSRFDGSVGSEPGELVTVVLKAVDGRTDGLVWAGF
ncbi:MAG: hypothetical protein ACREQY_00105 [Candidatus Binatia bacterium]